jgi:hypothetical protein
LTARLTTLCPSATVMFEDTAHRRSSWSETTVLFDPSGEEKLQSSAQERRRQRC